ncbi:MAG: hypothetical protein MJK10_05735 [Pseudomonadales bacterium]|nr:hypothetical protein [Pseudomonadales bacterium]NRA14207.1 hypothetical protein [Oceanospirillaceae bacterium]
MFVVQLKFSINKSRAAEFMQRHNDWIKAGFDAGVFLVVGKLQPGLGGAIVANNCSLTQLQQRLGQDPFVKNEVVSVEILEISPVKTEQRLQFLLD